ncbi:MAG TPA: GAF domain-containing protein [Falsiroseomonas sp.]|jgi:GAF domain-containing protein|nr:GAF domain-containing protein [Falsiroseomonas sp.]
MTDLTPPLAAVAAAGAQTDQPETLFRALDAALGATIGHRLFTILVIHPGAQESQRYYSNQPQAYPIGGRKPITESWWFKQVVFGGEPWIGKDYADVQAAFYDHELIRSLGCESALNIPVRWNGATLGTLNLLDAQAHYTEAHLPAAKLFAALAVPGLMQVIAKG